MKVRNIVFPAIAALAVFTARAQSPKAPEFIDPAPGADMIVHALSDNGLWAVSEQASKTDGSIAPSGGTIINTTTLAQEDISHVSGLSGVSDITDDGNLVVGEANGLPAFWSRDDGKWTTLPIPKGYSRGHINAVTPDGRRAVGYVVPADNEFWAYPVIYDLPEGTLREMPGLPTLDMQNLDQHQNYMQAISADGRYALGSISSSYVLPVAPCSYIYDIDNGTYTIIGFTERHNAGDNIYGKWTPHAENMLFIEAPTISCSGDWVTGIAYMSEPVDGSEFNNEYRATFRYDVRNDIFTLYPESDYAGFAVADNGTVFAISPAVNPYSFSHIRSGDYFISFEQIFRQAYGIDFKAATGYENTGKPIAMSADGSVMAMQTSPTDSYILRLNEPLADAASKVNLLEEFTVSPAEESTISTCSQFELQFDRRVVANATQTAKISFKADDGSVSYTPIQQGGFNADGTKVTITFRTRDLEKDKAYTLTIPAGCIYLEGNQKYTNRVIKIRYNGRDKSPVVITDAYPADGASVASLDLSSNPIILTFDSELRLAEKPLGYLYRAGEETPFCELNILAAKNQLLCFPVAAQHLFKGTEYVVVIPAGTVTDISGNGANKEILLSYNGSYERVPNADDTFLFNEDCSGYDNFMFFEGDNLNPAQIPAGWGFTKDTTPWYIVRSSNESTDMAMASHSMYSPAGQSDDWMVLPQLFIPDGKCSLQFDAQSYLNGMDDRLKVYAYTSDDVYNTMTRQIADRILADGQLVFNEILSPGKSEEGLENDWVNYVVDLADYAGKYVYLAFVNDNRAASAVFVDNIRVIHDMDFLVSFENSSRVVRRDDIEIHGAITVASEINTYNDLHMELTDADGVTIATIDETGLNLKKNDSYRFRFSRALPLEAGVINKFFVKVRFDNAMSTITSTVRNMTFQPAKKVVIEEYTGRDCTNCPLGYVAFDYIRERYGNAVIPIGIHTYQSDPLGNGMNSYSEYLGIDKAGAPSARVNRNSLITYPVISTGNGYSFSGAGIFADNGVEEKLWYDQVRDELAQPAELGIDFSSAYDAQGGTVNVDCTVRSALNSSDNSINIFAVLLENKLEAGYQANGYSGNSDPLLGEWGAGGKYGNSFVYPFTVDDVARSVWGTTFNGTGGLIPATLNSSDTYNTRLSVAVPSSVVDINNCDIVVMLIDAAGGKVINAQIAPVGKSTSDFVGGVDNIAADGCDITVAGSHILAKAPGQMQLCVFSVYGETIAAAEGSDSIDLDMSSFGGFAIVCLTTADGGSLTRKVLIRQ